jgi:uncharacterized glyoxalase superfamily protein PhnB
MDIEIHASFVPHADPDLSPAWHGFIGLAPKDLDDTFERLQAGGAEVVQEPTEHPYGARDRAFRDPAGSLLRIQGVR